MKTLLATIDLSPVTNQIGDVGTAVMLIVGLVCSAAFGLGAIFWGARVLLMFFKDMAGEVKAQREHRDYVYRNFTSNVEHEYDGPEEEP